MHRSYPTLASLSRHGSRKALSLFGPPRDHPVPTGRILGRVVRQGSQPGRAETRSGYGPRKGG